MKKIALLLILIAGATQLKAQQTWQVKPVKPLDSLTNFFKPYSTTPPNVLLLQPQVKTTNQQYANSNDLIVYSRMPVAVPGYTENMPVAKLSNDGFTMPVKKVTIIDPLAKDQQPAP